MDDLQNQKELDGEATTSKEYEWSYCLPSSEEKEQQDTPASIIAKHQQLAKRTHIEKCQAELYKVWLTLQY